MKLVAMIDTAMHDVGGSPDSAGSFHAQNVSGVLP